MISLKQQEYFFIMTMDGVEGNAVDMDLVSGVHESLDAIEAESNGPGALIITGTDKAFSTGLNIQAIMSYEAEKMERFGQELKRLYGRLVNFPLPTIAAINGHAFAAGAFLALACDYRVMREDRGWFCISEVDVGVPIDAEVLALAQAKLAPAVLRDAVLMGTRYAGPDCLSLGIVDAVSAQDTLVDSALEMAGALATKERKVFSALKTTLYGDYAAALGVS